MQSYRPDRVVRALTTVVSVGYLAMWAGAVIVLVTAPALKLFAGGDPDWVWGVKVPAVVIDSEATILTSWGPARLEVEDLRGYLRLPISMLPWWLFSVLWTHTAMGGGVMLAFLHHLRRIFQSAQAGAPFDAGNAGRLRSLGLLLFAFAVLDGIAGSVASLTVSRGLTSSTLTVPAGLHVDAVVVLVGLVLIALAEVFRRGAALEHEQSLVV